MFLRTCLKCGTNCYSPSEYAEHMKEAHGAGITKTDIAEPRTVKPTMADTGQDVPEEILVKPIKKDKKEPKVAETRKRRKRRTKAEIEADKKKEGK